MDESELFEESRTISLLWIKFRLPSADSNSLFFGRKYPAKHPQLPNFILRLGQVFGNHARKRFHSTFDVLSLFWPPRKIV